MRINEIKSDKVTQNLNSEYKKYDKTKLKFVEAFQKELDNFQEDKLNDMLLQIDNAANKLKDTLTLEDLLKYKKLVKNFLKEATNGMFNHTKKEQVDIRGRKKIYSITEKINEKLEKLTEEFLKDNDKNIQLLKMIEDIRGLLIDIYF
ncbi:MAG: YaaR family protein [Thermoanaerobacteraceae bacterium]